MRSSVRLLVVHFEVESALFLLEFRDTSPILVCLVCLVCLVYLVGLVGLSAKPQRARLN